jgi:hypothetical protein
MSPELSLILAYLTTTATHKNSWFCSPAICSSCLRHLRKWHPIHLPKTWGSCLGPPSLMPQLYLICCIWKSCLSISLKFLFYHPCPSHNHTSPRPWQQPPDWFYSHTVLPVVYSPSIWDFPSSPCCLNPPMASHLSQNQTSSLHQSARDVPHGLVFPNIFQLILYLSSTLLPTKFQS